MGRVISFWIELLKNAARAWSPIRQRTGWATKKVGAKNLEINTIVNEAKVRIKNPCTNKILVCRVNSSQQLYFRDTLPARHRLCPKNPPDHCHDTCGPILGSCSAICGLAIACMNPSMCDVFVALNFAMFVKIIRRDLFDMKIRLMKIGA